MCHISTNSKYPVNSSKSKTEPSTQIYACMKYRPDVSSETSTLLRVTFAKFIPTFFLVLISTLLIIEIRKLSKTLKKLTNATKTSQRLQKNRTLALLTALVAMSILVVELPGIIVSLIIAYGESDLLSCKRCVVKKKFLIIHIVILVLYPSNFLIYCFLSEKFRKAVASSLPCKSSGNSGRTKSSTLSSSRVSSKI